MTTIGGWYRGRILCDLPKSRHRKGCIPGVSRVDRGISTTNTFGISILTHFIIEGPAVVPTKNSSQVILLVS